MSGPELLQKILARAGCGSRRACERLILDGRVTVDGTTVSELGVRADPERQKIAVDGKPVKKLESFVYYALNKPKGVLCSSSDPEGRPLAVALIPEKRRIYTVGRLDKDTEGLILLTNDGEFANLLTHPRYRIPRTYLARVVGKADFSVADKLRRGVWLSEGKTGPANVKVLRRSRGFSTLIVSIREGLNREVRRMLAKVGLKVKRLRRIRIGSLRLDDMPIGAYRKLTEAEVAKLRKYAERAISPSASFCRQGKAHRNDKPIIKRRQLDEDRLGDRKNGRKSAPIYSRHNRHPLDEMRRMDSVFRRDQDRIQLKNASSDKAGSGDCRPQRGEDRKRENRPWRQRSRR